MQDGIADCFIQFWQSTISSVKYAPQSKIDADQSEEVSKVSKKSKPELQNMKYEVAREFGINLNQGYNGNVAAKDNGRVGGQMVKKMIEDYQRQHSQTPMQ